MARIKNATAEEIREEISAYITHPENKELVRRAIDYATVHHEGQFRKSGEPYIIHALNVGYILATLRVGPKTICAGLLHDVIEDCGISKEQMAKDFDEEIAELVESVTKIGNIQFKDQKEYQAANHRKIFIAMAKDVRVILIKLVDRLHNMRTLQYQPAEKQRRIASETLEVYAPIAHRIGISEVKNELEDLAFMYLNREEYYRIAHLVEAKKAERDEAIREMIANISAQLDDKHIKYRIFGRSKHLYSIYKKMTKKNKRFDEILDLLAIRIVTETELNCYEILGYIHATYRPIPGRLKDYIAVPKMNMYQSLHTTVVGEQGRIFEVQIRTEEMDSIAERGIAAHWRYKEGTKYDATREQKEIEEKLSWLKEFANFNEEESQSASEYMDTLTKDVFEANVYVMTPKGRVIDLPNGSTPVDFAYRIHTDVGHATIGAIVNESLVPLNTVLKTGAEVKLRTTKQNVGPSEDWLKFVKTNQARNKIRQFLTKKELEAKKEKTDAGEKILRDELTKRGFDAKEYMDKSKIENIFSSFQVSTYIDLMYGLAVKSINPTIVVEKLTNQKRTVLDNDTLAKQLNRETRKRVTSKNGLKISGVESMMMSLAQCCSPVYGDDIIGYITKGQGVKVHRTDCPNIKGINQRLIPVEWEDDVEEKSYVANLHILSTDRNNLLGDLITICSQCKASTQAVSCVVNNEDLTVTTKLSVNVKDVYHLNNLMANLRKVDNVLKVERQVL